MTKTTRAICPYCGTENVGIEIPVSFHIEKYTPVTCEREIGGCERVFIVEAMATMTQLVRKIEGQQ